MKDAYSFDVDEEGLDKSYELMKETYKKIFDELHIPMHCIYGRFLNNLFDVYHIVIVKSDYSFFCSVGM